MIDSAFADVVQEAERRIGTTLKGKWHIERLVGVGGMASVYAATHRNNKRVAIKMLHPSLSLLRTVRERFQREGYVANSVGHPGAVSVDDDDVSDDGCAFLVMELLEGETLGARAERKGGRLHPEQVLACMDQVLDTLIAAHAKGIVHRDLKPDNLFLTRAHDVKVLDFGIARLREFGVSALQTQTGAAMGSPAFMPPEQALGHWENVDERSDLWAVGATMFTLLTGSHVHEASTGNELLIFAATKPAAPVASRAPDVPTPISEILDRALAFDKEARWQDATSMRRAVRKALIKLDASESSTERAHETIGPVDASAEIAQDPTSSQDVPAPVPSEDSQETAVGATPSQALPSSVLHSVPPTWSDETSLPLLRKDQQSTTSPGTRRVGRPIPPRAWAVVVAIGSVVLSVLIGVLFRSSRIDGETQRAASIPPPTLAPMLEPARLAPIPEVTPLRPADQPGVVSVEALPIATSPVQLSAAASITTRAVHASPTSQPSAAPTPEPIFLEETPPDPPAVAAPSAASPIPAAAFPSAPNLPAATPAPVAPNALPVAPRQGASGSQRSPGVATGF
ncbi:MAG TPA: protein kinase [Polyangiaceae bacterium]|jgi:serine/threonine-protein kinase